MGLLDGDNAPLTLGLLGGLGAMADSFEPSRLPRSPIAGLLRGAAGFGQGYIGGQQIGFLNDYRQAQTEALKQKAERQRALQRALTGGAPGGPAAAPIPTVQATDALDPGVMGPARAQTRAAIDAQLPAVNASRAAAADPFGFIPAPLRAVIPYADDPLAQIQHYYDKSREAPKVEEFYDAQGRPVKKVYDAASGGFVLPAGAGAKTDVLSPGAFNQKLAIAQAGKTDVKLNVDNNLGKGLSENVKDIAGQSYAAASSAVDALNTTARVRAALDKANLGPGATFRQGVDQIAYNLGLGGQTNEERLAATRQVIQGMSELALNARSALKGQGQVSDYEGRLLADARAGRIDNMTLPEIKTILDVTDRLQEKAYKNHQRILGVIQNNPNFKDLAPFYEVPPLPTAGAAPPAAGGGGNPPALQGEGWQDMGGGVRIRRVQ